MSLTESFTFKLGDSGIVLNTDSIGLPFFDINRVTGLSNAPYRETERDHEGQDGGFIDAEFEKGRHIVIEGTAYADALTMESYLDTLKANYAPSTSLVPLYFLAPGRPERLLFVKPLGVSYDWDMFRRIGTANAQIRMFAEDPRIYDSTEQSHTTNLTDVVTSDFGFSLGFSFGFGTTTAVQNGITVTNSGNRSTPATFTITGPVTDPQIVNDATGQRLKFSSITLTALETLVVNTYYRTARLNGTSNRRNNLVQADWFNLEPGETSIRFQAASSDPSATLNIKFRNAWR